MTIGEWLKRSEATLKTAGVTSARLDTLILLEANTGRRRSWLLANLEAKLAANTYKRANRQLSRREAREPLAYITGSKEFFGLPFKVTSNVLVPRPETETMVEYTLEHAPKRAEVLEIGTGSGAVAVALKFNRPDLEVTATDISATTLAIAKTNARRHKTKLNLVQGDLFHPITRPYQIILANLPYVPTGTRHERELSYEPSVALFAGADGLRYYRPFVTQLRRFLEAGGWALIETSPTQRKTLAELAQAAGLSLKPISEYIFKLD